jgi:hypothetical protein
MDGERFDVHEVPVSVLTGLANSDQATFRDQRLDAGLVGGADNLIGFEGSP